MSGIGGIRRTRVDRTVVLALLGTLGVCCWAYLLVRVRHPAAGGSAAVVAAMPWRGHDLVLLFALWLVVIAATMLPAAAPAVLLYARVRRLRGGPWVLPATAMFMLGEVLAWSGCAAVATLAGWVLHDAGALDEAMAVAHPSAGALLLVAAGVYQWTPAKHACLEDARAPLAFVLTHWRGGAWGALRMGGTDARYGIGCCWLLLALVLPAGVLNLPVIGAVLALVLAEKLLPGGHIIACATGVGLLAWGTALLFP